MTRPLPPLQRWGVHFLLHCEEERRSTRPTPPLIFTIKYALYSLSSYTQQRAMIMPLPPLWGGEEEYDVYSIVCLISSLQWSLTLLHHTSRLYPLAQGWEVGHIHYSIARRSGGVHRLLFFSSLRWSTWGLHFVQMRIRSRTPTPSWGGDEVLCWLLMAGAQQRGREGLVPAQQRMLLDLAIVMWKWGVDYSITDSFT